MLNNQVSKAVRLAIAFGAASTAAFTANVNAAEEGVEEVERIEVTGSRIKRTDMESASPVQITSAEDIEVAGFTRVEDMMNSLPQLEASSTAFQSNGASGTATLDLRGLGAQRTLVLINGRRAQAGGVYTQSADVNQIPAALIKRVEVLTGGGSSTYGADAVAGVVNFVMDNEFEGFEVNVGSTAYQHNNDNKYIQGLMDKRNFEYPSGSSGFDGSSFDFSATIGGAFDGGKGHAVGYITYNKQNELRQGARDYSSCALGKKGQACGGSGNAVVPNFYLSKANADGSFNWTKGQYEYWTLDPNGGFTPSSGNVYNYAPINHFMRPDERQTFGLFADYEINDNFRPYMEAMFMRDRTTAQIAESGTFFAENYAIDINSPLLSDTQRQQLKDAFGIADDGQFAAYIGKRNVEGGPRANKLEHNSFRLVLGTEGELSDNWAYDAWMQYGSTSSSSAYINDFFGPRIATALSANGEACSGDCIPYEVFTYQGVTGEAAGALTGTAILNGVTEQFIAGGFVTGEFGFSLPSSDTPVAAVFGAEYRKEQFERTADEVYAQGLLLGQGGATKSLNGEYTVKELYTEISLPVVEDAPFAESMTVDLGYRWSDYSLSGSEPTYKVALDWNPTADWKVRASYNRAVRAANNGELFAQQSEGLWNGTDPCAGDTPSLTEAQCANTGVTAAQYGNIGASPASQYNGLFGGNPNLTPEIADTITFGVVANPFDDFNFSVDYWDIELEDVIGTVGAEIIVKQCATTGDAAFCDRINRSPGSGSLWVGQGRVTDTNANLGKRHWEGVDVSANYDVELGEGTLKTNLIGTYMLTKEYDSLPGIGEKYDCIDTLDNSCFAQPKWRHVMTMSYDTGSFWSATLKWRFFGKVSHYTGDDILVQNGISSQSYIDLKGRFSVNDYTTILVGVNNVMDKEPPLVGSTLSTNGNAIAGYYDTLGRYFHASVNFKF